jgi:hypothetical protein
MKLSTYNYENKRIAINHFEINGMINITPLKLLNKKYASILWFHVQGNYFKP